ncbi:NadS family protein [Pseudomonas syringae]|uniref:NadS family protein n=1 Tax=Pseudomonas syringae TaxID=317 RepID=UPI003F760C82
MEKNLFDRLVESMTEMDEIDRGERQPSREFHINAAQVKKIRQATGLSQATFAKHIDVAVGTLRNWEQGRREPEGPARALLRAIHNDPEHVLAALSFNRGEIADTKRLN